jgi:uncharacterized membrane protein
MKERQYDYTILGLIVGSLLGMAVGFTFFFAHSATSAGAATYVGAILGAAAGYILDHTRLNRPT